MKKHVLCSLVLAVMLLFTGCMDLTSRKKTNNSTENSNSSIATKYENPVVETGETALYKDAFTYFDKGLGALQFVSAKNKAEKLKEEGYEVEIIEPEDRILAQIYITAADGDVVYVQCCPDFHMEDNIDRVSLVQYEHGEYYICVSNSAFLTSSEYTIGDPNTEKGFYSVDTFEECLQFMFGE